MATLVLVVVRPGVARLVPRLVFARGKGHRKPVLPCLPSGLPSLIHEPRVIPRVGPAPVRVDGVHFPVLAPVRPKGVGRVVHLLEPVGVAGRLQGGPQP